MIALKGVVPFILFFSASIFGQVDGTTGLPLGGIGTGAVKYNAGSGTFSANFRTPTRNGDYQSLSNTQFQAFTKRGASVLTSQKLIARQDNGRADDDAVFPLHRVNFGELNAISISMTAYLPFSPKSIPDMCHPAAMFEFSVNNSMSDSAAISIAFQISMPDIPSAITDTGLIASSSSLQLCLIGSFAGGNGDLSYGSDNGFFSTGICSNQLTSSINRLALRISLSSFETKTLRFVLSWYQPDEIAHYQYANFWNGARSAAVSALNNFSNFKDNSEELVNRMRSSNLPSWLVDQTLNSLVNLVNNSVYFQDGRYCHTEGMWEPEGTMDQMWHARQIYTMINPNLAWSELEWWARTQHVLNYTGQIHHDFGTNFNYVSWDNTEHSDYRSINEWVDLNCGFIISVYEAFIATADQGKLDYFWPYLKKAAQRILDQVNLYGSSQYPYTFQSSLSTYDAGGNSQAYNTGLSAAAYYIMSYLSNIKGETDTIYQNAFQNAVKGFEDRWLDNPYPLENFCESVIGGPWITGFLKLGSFWEKQKLDQLFTAVSTYYDPLNSGMGYNGGTYSEWSPYLIGHLGGYALQTNHSNIWSALQRDMYERNYLNRNLVFNQQLGIPSKVTSPIWIATNTSSSNQYISIPILWRNYYNIAGYHRNEYSKELWLEPNLFDSLNHQLQDALIFTPNGYAVISYDTYGNSYQNQEIVFKPDYSMDVSAIYVWDLYSDSANSIQTVKVNGVDTDYLRFGDGDQKHLKLNWAGTIPLTGITIQLEGEPKPGVQIPADPENLQAVSLSPSQIELKWQSPSAEISGYKIEININDSFQTLATTTASDTFFIDTGLLKSTLYRYRVRAYNSQGVSGPSNECEGATQDGGNGEVIAALNSGGNTYLSESGIQYIADAGPGWVSGGSIYSTTSAIEGTADDELYQTERYGNFSYSIPLGNGAYDIVLKFAEIYQDAKNARVFHVDAEGNRIIRTFDLYLRTGKYKAYDVVVPVQVNDGMLNIDFISVIDNAKLSGMEIRRNVVGIDEPGFNSIPDNYSLFQNYPNPFNPVTHIQYALPEESYVKIIIYNILGERAAVLVDEREDAGFHSIEFNANDFPGGIYFYKITAGRFQSVKKMVLLK